MNSKEMIEEAAAENGITGVMAIVKFTGVSYSIVTRALKDDDSVKLVHLKKILNAFGKKLNSVAK